MAGNKVMNPVMKMRKKQKEKEREKRREAKKHRKKQDEDQIDDTYHSMNIHQLKDKADNEHYETNALSWNDIQRNMLTGSFNRDAPVPYGRGMPNQNYAYGGYHQRNQPNYHPQGQYNRQNWQGDTLSSQPVLYNQPPGATSHNQADQTIKNNVKQISKDLKKDEHWVNDPLNPHKAKQNFKETLFKKEKENESETKDDKSEQPESDALKEFEKIKGSPIQTNTKFRPAALRKRKKNKQLENKDASSMKMAKVGDSDDLNQQKEPVQPQIAEAPQLSQQNVEEEKTQPVIEQSSKDKIDTKEQIMTVNDQKPDILSSTENKQPAKDSDDSSENSDDSDQAYAGSSALDMLLKNY